MHTFMKPSHGRNLGSTRKSTNRTNLGTVLCLYEFGEFDEEAR